MAARALTPTVKLVRERTGGSFTTVKDWLDAWTAERTQTIQSQRGLYPASPENL